jgi:hypothetical protein
MLAPQPLAQDKGVLRADGDNQAEAQQEAGNEGGHVLRLGLPRRAVNRDAVMPFNRSLNG